MSWGSWREALDMADWTSCAAASILRSSANLRVMIETPWPLVEVMESRPAMVENSRSSGVATALAMVSGLAPGKFEVT